MLVPRLWRRLPWTWLKFLLVLVPLQLAVALAFTALSHHIKGAELRQVLVARMAAVADSNLQVLGDSLWALDEPRTRQILRAIAVSSDAVCAEVTDLTLPFHDRWPEPACRMEVEDGVVERLIVVQGRSLGLFRLSYSYAPIDQALAAEWRDDLGRSALLLVAAVLAFLIAHRLAIGRPVGRLLRSIHSAEDEAQRQPVAWQAADELGEVVAAYNNLLARLTQKEQAIRTSQERLALAIAATRSSVWDLNLRTGDMWWSSEFPLMLGYPPDELAMVRDTWESLIHPDDLAQGRPSGLHDLDLDQASWRMTYRMRRHDGGWLWVEDQAMVQRDHRGQAIRLTGVIADVHERITAGLELARERALLQATLENVDQGIVMYDREHRLVAFNPRAAELLNLPVALLAANPRFEEVTAAQVARGEFAEYGDDPARSAERWAELPTAHVAYKMRRPGGQVIELRSTPLAQGGFVCTYADVTAEVRAAEEIFAAMQETRAALAELQETQASLVQAEKMSSLGLLVAGIAHEINTPVGIAYGCAGHLEQRTRELVAAFEGGTLKRSGFTGYAGSAQEACRLILTNLTRAVELIQSFKQVAVDQTSGERRRFDLGAYIEELVTSLRPRLRGSVATLTLEAPAGLACDSYPGALSQVLTNLVVNALTHAFEGRSQGQIRLSAEAVPAAEAGSGAAEVRIVVTDDGIGIPPANLGQIFEPFFTTRRGSGGSGLGLHIVFNLVTQSLGGRITVDSTPGIGTSFTLILPCHAPGRADRPGQGS